MWTFVGYHIFFGHFYSVLAFLRWEFPVFATCVGLCPIQNCLRQEGISFTDKRNALRDKGLPMEDAHSLLHWFSRKGSRESLRMSSRVWDRCVMMATLLFLCQFYFSIGNKKKIRFFQGNTTQTLTELISKVQNSLKILFRIKMGSQTLSHEALKDYQRNKISLMSAFPRMD